MCPVNSEARPIQNARLFVTGSHDGLKSAADGRICLMDPPVPRIDGVAALVDEMTGLGDDHSAISFRPQGPLGRARVRLVVTGRRRPRRGGGQKWWWLRRRERGGDKAVRKPRNADAGSTQRSYYIQQQQQQQQQHPAVCCWPPVAASRFGGSRLPTWNVRDRDESDP